jgi:ABC-type sulfate transport system permease subunit
MILLLPLAAVFTEALRRGVGAVALGLSPSPTRCPPSA